MSDEVYGELFALGQCMPGPTSTQVSFAIGVIKKGVRGEWYGGVLQGQPAAHDWLFRAQTPCGARQPASRGGLGCMPDAAACFGGSQMGWLRL